MDSYEKKYKEAKDKVAARFGTNVAKEIFTDLYESEGERIRKEIISFIQDHIDEINLQVSGDYDTRDKEDIALQEWCKKVIAWLENIPYTIDHEKREGFRLGYKACLEKQGEQKEYTFKSIPRLLDMIEPTDKAKAYCQKLIDTLTNEGYNTDAKIVGEVLKGWNGEDVPMAVMDEQKPTWSEEDEVMLQACLDTLQTKSLFGVVDTVMTEWLKSLKVRLRGNL